MLSGKPWQAWETILDVIKDGTDVVVRSFGVTPVWIRDKIPKAAGVRIQRDAAACRYQAFHPEAVAAGEAYNSFSRAWGATSEDDALKECIGWLWKVNDLAAALPDLS